VQYDHAAKMFFSISPEVEYVTKVIDKLRRLWSRYPTAITISLESSVGRKPGDEEAESVLTAATTSTDGDGMREICWQAKGS